MPSEVQAKFNKLFCTVPTQFVAHTLECIKNLNLLVQFCLKMDIR